MARTVSAVAGRRQFTDNAAGRTAPGRQRDIPTSLMATGTLGSDLSQFRALGSSPGEGMGSRSFQVFDVEYLFNLELAGRLQLKPDFQRESIWPNAAKSYLIDTVVEDRPVPMLFLQKSASAQSGLGGYSVVDGQQRLRAIFEFIDGRYRLSGPQAGERRGMGFRDLEGALQHRILRYELPAMELIDYGDAEIRDIFIRLNQYGVRLSPQELRHAQSDGPFKLLVESVGKWPFWRARGVVSNAAAARMRADEIAAELLILLMEGEAQDKKAAINEFYELRPDEIPGADEAANRLQRYLDWISLALPERTRLFKPTHLYGLIGALDIVTRGGETLSELSTAIAGGALTTFESQIRDHEPLPNVARYEFAASRQTDNVGPRNTRLRILADVLREVIK